MPERHEIRDEIGAITVAIGRQRDALARRDLTQLEASSRELVRGLTDLHAAGPLRTPEEMRALVAAQLALRANASLLNRESAANSRAISVLFDAPATYGPAGSGPRGRTSRALDAAA